MFLRIENSSGVPIIRQIVDQIHAQYASGALRPGDRLPSVRALARELAVNQNTILHVYERLEAEGLIERRHGDGTYAAQGSAANQRKAQIELLQQEAERLARHAQTLNLDLKTLQQTLERAWRRQEPSSSAPQTRKKGEQS